jgi:hypothetical protein
LQEKGFINATNIEKYMKKERKDASGVLVLENSLKYLTANSKNLEEEEFLLQLTRHEMGVHADRDWPVKG